MGKVARRGKVNLSEGYGLAAARHFDEAMGRSVGVRERGKEVVESAILLNDDNDVRNGAGSWTCGGTAARPRLGRHGGSAETGRAISARGEEESGQKNRTPPREIEPDFLQVSLLLFPNRREDSNLATGLHLPFPRWPESKRTALVSAAVQPRHETVDASAGRRLVGRERARFTRPIF